MKNKEYTPDFKVDETIETLIGPETKLTGVLKCESSIRFEGSIEGKIYCHGVVHIGEKSVVNADIFSQNLIVAGKIIGNVEVAKNVEILSTGTIEGDIKAKMLNVAAGANFSGNVTVEQINPLYDDKK